MPSFLGRVIDPLVGSKSPARIFIKVVLPAPLGPVIAYRRPAMKLQVTSSNSILPPNRIVMLLTESIASDYTVKLSSVLCDARPLLSDVVSLQQQKEHGEVKNHRRPHKCGFEIAFLECRVPKKISGHKCDGKLQT